MSNELYNCLSLIVNLLIMVAGFSAILIYRAQEKNKLKTAARLVVSQIRQIESCVSLLRNTPNLNAQAVYASKLIMVTNYWAENGHILTRKFNENERQTLDSFYSLAEEIEKARKDICTAITNTWNDKDLVYQFMVMNGISDQNDNTEMLNEYDQSSSVYFPKMPIEYLMKNLALFAPVSGTVVFDKLYKLSK